VARLSWSRHVGHLMPISMEDHDKRGTSRMLAGRTGPGCEAVRVQVRRISSGRHVRASPSTSGGQTLDLGDHVVS
jgi:hypothetical protein